jgi:lysophospholipase L1-like esterase
MTRTGTTSRVGPAARPPRSSPARDLAVAIAVAAILLVALEGVVRVRDRVKHGRWPATPAVERYEAARRMGMIVMEHPELIGVLRPGGTATVRGSRASINSLGYRGAEFARPKPAGVFRVLAIGGSTTFDVCVSSDEATWTSRLQDALRARFAGRAIEVVNGGHPGYTTLEMLRKLETIDLDIVEPDLVLAFVGLNDLQPSAAPGFRADYSVGHAEIQRRFLGFESRPPGLLERSVLIHKLRRRLGRLPADVPATPRRAAPLPEAEAVYRERLARIVDAAAAGEAGVAFVTQAIRFGHGRAISVEDSISAFRWLPYLTVDGIIDGLARYNAITREVGAERGAAIVDVAASLDLEDTDFADYCHWSDAGAERMGRFVATSLPESLFAGAGAAGGASPAGAR